MPRLNPFVLVIAFFLGVLGATAIYWYAIPRIPCAPTRILRTLPATVRAISSTRTGTTAEIDPGVHGLTLSVPAWDGAVVGQDVTVMIVEMREGANE